jgi:hypothetical protein
MRLAAAIAGLGLVFATACGSPTVPSKGQPTALSAAPSFGAVGLSPDLAACLAAVVHDEGCFSATRGLRAQQRVLSGLGAPGAPTSLTALVDRTSVTLTWSAPVGGDAVDSYAIEAGSASGRADLANVATGNAATSFSTTGVPAGTYFVRLRALNGSGTGPASNEVIVVVSDATTCSSPPNSPTGLTSLVNGSTVSLAWTAPIGGCAATSYIVQAGSGAGLSNLASVSTGSLATTFSATSVGVGTYFVRVRAGNASGQSAPSNEVIVAVGPNFSGNWNGDYTVTACFAGTAGGAVGPVICGSEMRVGNVLPISFSLSQNGSAVSGSVRFGSSGTGTLSGSVGATGVLSASGSGTYVVGATSYTVSIGGFSVTTDGTRLTGTWGEFIIRTGTSVLSGSADVRLSTRLVTRTP